MTSTPGTATAPDDRPDLVRPGDGGAGQGRTTRSAELPPAAGPDSPPPAGRCAHATIRRRAAIEYVLDGEALLYDPVTAAVYYLNATALEIWRGCADGTVPQLVSTLCRRYGIDADTAGAHVHDVMDRLAASGLLSVEDADVACA